MTRPSGPEPTDAQANAVDLAAPHDTQPPVLSRPDPEEPGLGWRVVLGWWVAGWFVTTVSLAAGGWLLAGLLQTGGQLAWAQWWPLAVRPLLAGTAVSCAAMFTAGAGHTLCAGRPPRQRRRRELLVGLVLVVVLAGVLILAWGDLASAAISQPPPAAPAPAPVPAATDLHQVITNARNWLMGFLIALATLFGTIGAVRYMSANSDPGEVDAAKRAFKNAGIGYSLAILAPLFLTALRSVVGG